MDPKAYKPRDFLWSQLDKRWAKKKLGKSQASVEDFGCVSLWATYIINRFNKDHNKLPIMYPNEVIDKSKYEPNGDFYWNSVDKITKGKLVHTYNKNEADYTLMMVWIAGQTHWVVLLDGDLCYDSLQNGSACIRKRVQKKLWKENGGFVYYKIA